MRAFILAVCAFFLFSFSYAFQEFYPSGPGMVWHYTGHMKDSSAKLLVEAKIILLNKIDSVQYMYYAAPSVDVRFMVRVDDKGAYMKLLKYPFPILKFLTVDVYLDPEIQFLKFPLTEGETWTQNLKATADLVPFKLNRDIKVKFTVFAREKFRYKGADLDCYRVRMERDEGTGSLWIEDNWFASGLGFVRGDNPEYFIELNGYDPVSAMPASAMAK
jgi:hypothetical protein